MSSNKNGGTSLRPTALYRATGADLPFGDPLTAHGVGMEGYFWRVTDRDRGRALIALIGVNDDGQGGTWSTVGLGAHPGGFLKAGALEGGFADPVKLGATTGDGRFIGEPGRVRVDLGPKAQLDLTIEGEVGWPRRRFGGSSWFQSVPALNQY